MRVKYVDMHSSKPLPDYAEYKILSHAVPTHTVVNENPDLLVSLGFGNTHLNYDTPKICINTENQYTHPSAFDISICANIYPNMERINALSNASELSNFDCFVRHNHRPDIAQTPKTKFCAFLYRKMKSRPRNIFCKKMMQYKHVHCLGRALNNTPLPKDFGRYGNWQDTQLQIYKEYKFVIAFENSSAPNYITEKIFQALLAGCIPIYWGADNIKQYINPDCFIHVNDFKNFGACIAHIKQVDTDMALYEKYKNAPPVLSTSKLHHMTVEALGDWIRPHIDYILSDVYTPVGKIYGWQKYKYLLWKNITESKIWWQQKLLYNARP